MKYLPPTDDISHFLLFRGYGDTSFILHLPGGNSYIMNRDELIRWFGLLGIDYCEWVLDYTWNFNRVLFDFSTKRPRVLSEEEMKEVISNFDSNVELVGGTSCAVA